MLTSLELPGERSVQSEGDAGLQIVPSLGQKLYHWWLIPGAVHGDWEK